MTRLLLALVLFIALLVPSGASAQETGEQKEEGNIVYQRRTVVTFDEEDVIDGNLVRPDGELIEGGQATRFPSLFRVRENFRKEILDSVHAL